MTLVLLDPTPIYKRHRCERQHRTARTFMKCAIPRAVWIQGEGEYALIAWCRVPSVMLYPTRGPAEAAKGQIDQSACGHGCTGKHEIVRVPLVGW